MFHNIHTGLYSDRAYKILEELRLGYHADEYVYDYYASFMRDPRTGEVIIRVNWFSDSKEFDRDLVINVYWRCLKSRANECYDCIEWFVVEPETIYPKWLPFGINITILNIFSNTIRFALTKLFRKDFGCKRVVYDVQHNNEGFWLFGLDVNTFFSSYLYDLKIPYEVQRQLGIEMKEKIIKNQDPPTFVKYDEYTWLAEYFYNDFVNKDDKYNLIEEPLDPFEQETIVTFRESIEDFGHKSRAFINEFAKFSEESLRHAIPAEKINAMIETKDDFEKSYHDIVNEWTPIASNSKVVKKALNYLRVHFENIMGVVTEWHI